MSKRLLCIITTVAMLTTMPAFGATDEEAPKLKKLSRKDIDELEQKADTGRTAFFQNNFPTAEDTFQSLAADFTISQPLYKCELAATCLATEEKDDAFDNLFHAFTALEGFIDPKLEKRAASIWGSETKKIYRGDPYEQATLCLLLGMMFLERNDFDNALACFKTGQLADSDVANELYTCDFGLLQALEAKCYRLRNQHEEHDELANLAVESYELTHPALRDMISQKQALLNDLKENKKKQGKIEELDWIEKSIDLTADSVDYDYVAPLFNDWNTLVVIWAGKAPSMIRTGEYGEQRTIVKNPSVENRYEVLVDEYQWHDAIQGFADVTFQATTRGGRMMDNVLANQAKIKDFTKGMGDAFIDAADDVGSPEAALVMLAAGLVIKGVSAAMKVEADIRCWRTLPDTFQVIPIDLAPGNHRLDIGCFDQYIKTRTVTAQITVENEPVNIAFVKMPTN